MQGNRLPEREIVLLGIGHTNAHILKMWRMEPIPRARLTCISNFPMATYSGMLPGVLAGQYEESAMEIDLVRLCAAANARLIVGNVAGLDLESRHVLFRDRPPIQYDILSVGVGSLVVPSTTSFDDEESPRRISIKPMQTFMSRLQQHVARVPDGAASATLAVVGAGAGGVELAFCIKSYLQKHRSDIDWNVELLSGGANVLPEYREATRRKVEATLSRKNIQVRAQSRVVDETPTGLTLEDGTTIDVDLTVWANGASAPPLLSGLGLPLDELGYVQVDQNLQSTSGEPIFAVGDAASFPASHVCKAGVFAVREGPVLWDNIQRMIRNQGLLPYRPQRDFLRLLNTGDGDGIGQYGAFAFQGKWVWNWKDRIDRRFMAMYQDYSPKMTTVASEPDVEESLAHAMRCLGCGGKVGGSVLQRVLSSIEPVQRPETIRGIEMGGDDAALLSPQPGFELAATTDFFVAPWDDPYTVGRVAALHAASDCFAMGSAPFAALANIVLPLGKPKRQEACLRELLMGANEAFREMDVSLVGGHTIEGPHLSVGFTILSQHREDALTKARLQIGDQLVLTKPIGVGVLLAAHMQARCRAEWWQPVLETMCASNREAAEAATESGAAAVTDITGFGLAGHLGEMLEASTCTAQVDLSRLPILPGAEQLTEDGLESTLAPANRDWERIIRVDEADRRSAAYRLLFDPQTSGGLLIAIHQRSVETLLGRLAQTPTPGVVIGSVTNDNNVELALVKHHQ